MRVSAPLASLLAATLCLAAITAPTAVFAQNDVADSSNSTLVFNPDNVVDEIVISDDVSDAIPPSLIISGDDDVATGDASKAPVPEMRNPFIPTIAVHRPFDDLMVTTPDVGPIAVVRVKDGKKSKSPRKPFLPPQTEYLYGEFLILRVRSITKELLVSIRAPADRPAEHRIMLKRTLFNTKVSSDFSKNGWETEDTVTKRADEQIPALSALIGGSRDLTATVRGSVSTTFASSQAGKVDLSGESEFTLLAPAGKEAALWTTATQLDVFVCKARTNKIRTNPIDGQCDYSHSVTEEGEKFDVTVSDV